MKKNWDKYLETINDGAWFPFEKYNSYIKGNILDLGCGRGRTLASLFGKGNLYGIDVAEDTIKQAQQRYSDIKFFAGDGRDLPYENNFFDFIFSNDVIEHVEDYDKFVKEIERVLKPDGLCIIKTPNYPIKRLYDYIGFFRKKRRTYKDDPTHFSPMNYFKLSKVLNKYFNNVNIEVRNILGEKKIPFFRKIKKGNLLGNLIGQKLIAECRKR